MQFCPSCGRNDIVKSHAGGIEQQVLRMLHLRAYRCCDCGRRFYGRPQLAGLRHGHNEALRFASRHFWR